MNLPLVRCSTSTCTPRTRTDSPQARALRMSVMFGIGEEVESDTFAHNSKSLAYRPGFQQEFFKLM